MLLYFLMHLLIDYDLLMYVHVLYIKYIIVIIQNKQNQLTTGYDRLPSGCHQVNMVASGCQYPKQIKCTRHKRRKTLQSARLAGIFVKEYASIPCWAKSSNSSNFLCNFKSVFVNVPILFVASPFHVFKLSFKISISSNGSVRGDVPFFSSSFLGRGGILSSIMCKSLTMHYIHYTHSIHRGIDIKKKNQTKKF